LVLEDLVGGRRLAVDPDEIALRLAVRDFPLEQTTDRGPFVDLHIVREAAAVVVDEQNFHRRKPFWKWGD